MARIRAIEIDHFRGIKELLWFPLPGLNCLVGPGDSGKSSILDAVDFCLGARRSIQFTDADFYRLDVEVPIEISVTIGDLNDDLKNLEAYGMYLRGFDALIGEIEEEPERELETVLTVKLTVTSDLDPSWSLVSARAAAQGQSRNLSWNDRVRLAPTRIGVMANYHLGWQRGSVLNRLSEERADTSAALAKVAREARAVFGDQAEEQLGEALGIVAETAKELGIPIGDKVKAMLDAHSVSFSGGTISLHDEDGIPLRGLGTGSTRLLIAGLQRKAAARATIILMDEVEHGLEPHRIIRLLGSLGAKEKSPPLQVFMTTHSPVAPTRSSFAKAPARLALSAGWTNTGRRTAMTRSAPGEHPWWIVAAGGRNGPSSAPWRFTPWAIGPRLSAITTSSLSRPTKRPSKPHVGRFSRGARTARSRMTFLPA
jgi:putative ATP-dependent endonuclease of OLD family